MHAQSRIDPRTVAAYESRKTSSETCFAGKHPNDANAGIVNLDCATFPGDSMTAYRRAAETTDLTQRADYRNRLGGLLMKYSDDACTASIGRAANNEAVSNVVLNTLTTAFASASTVVGGDLAKSILSAGAATTSGTRDHVNAEVFRNTVISAISKAITNERNKQSNEIEQKMLRSVAEYNVDMMVRDINRYHQSCSYVKGLELVVQAVDRAELLNVTEQIRRYDVAIAGLREDVAKASAANKDALEKKLNEYIASRAAAVATGEIPVPTASTTATAGQGSTASTGSGTDSAATTPSTANSSPAAPAQPAPAAQPPTPPQP